MNTLKGSNNTKDSNSSPRTHLLYLPKVDLDTVIKEGDNSEIMTPTTETIPLKCDFNLPEEMEFGLNCTKTACYHNETVIFYELSCGDKQELEKVENKEGENEEEIEYYFYDLRKLLRNVRRNPLVAVYRFLDQFVKFVVETAMKATFERVLDALLLIPTIVLG